MPKTGLFWLALVVGLGAQAVSGRPQGSPGASPPLAFEVASVKPSAPGRRGIPTSNLPLTPGSTAQPKGGLFEASNWPLVAYIMFAYDVQPDQLKALSTSLPSWALSDAFDIEARAPLSPTREQMREMMKTLLEDRFALRLHRETADRPIFALVLSKPAKTGPHLAPHTPDSPPCPTEGPTTALPLATATVAGGFPADCGSILILASSGPGRLAVGGRDVPLKQLAGAISAAGGFVGDLNKPVEDRTGLAGTWDFVLEFAPQLPAGLPSPPAETSGAPTFLEALGDQLGLKLVNATGPVEQIVIDHIDHPAEN